jgi:hypothetical protein
VVPDPDTGSIWLNEDCGVNSGVGFSVNFCDTGTTATQLSLYEAFYILVSGILDGIFVKTKFRMVTLYKIICETLQSIICTLKLRWISFSATLQRLKSSPQTGFYGTISGLKGGPNFQLLASLLPTLANSTRACG